MPVLMFHFLLLMALPVTTLSGRCKIKTPREVLRSGEPLEMNCTMSSLPANDQLTFSWKGQDMSAYTTSFREENRVTLQIDDTTNFTGVSHFYCGPEDGIGVCGKLMLIGYPPVKPENIRCVSRNLEDMTCTWDLVKTVQDLGIPTKWTLRYKIGNRSQMVECPDQRRYRGSCFWAPKNQDDERLAFKSGYTYRMSVTAQNALSRVTSEEVLVEPNTEVKPNPASITYLPKQENGSLPLRLRVPERLSRDYKFEYRVHITCLTWPDEYTVLEGALNTKNEILLKDLIPASNYSLGVHIKPLGSGYWSEASNITISTRETAPAVSPSPVSFTQSIASANRRRVDLYWQPPGKRHRNGKITKYRIEVTSPRGSWTNDTKLMAPMVYPDLLNNVSYHFRVAAVTSAGTGPYSQPVQLQAATQALALPVDVVAETDQDSSGHLTANVTWTPSQDTSVSGYRVFLCPGYIDRPFGEFLAECKGELTIMKTHGPELWHAITGKVGRGYVVGVSLVDGRGYESGITWAECLSDRQTEPNQMRDLRLTDTDTNALVLHWSAIKCGVLIAGYQISYWPSAEGDRQGCEQGIKQDFPGGRKTTTIRLRDLKEGTKYSICARSLTSGGKYAQWSEMVSGETILPPPLALIISLAIVVPFAIFCLVFAIRAHRFVRKPIAMELPQSAPKEVYYTDDSKYTAIGDTNTLPGTENAGNRDSGHGSLSRNSESNSESSHISTQPAAETTFHKTAIGIPSDGADVRYCDQEPVKANHGKDVTTPVLNNTGYVCETHNLPDERQPMLPTVGDPREITPLLADSYFEEGSLQCRSPIRPNLTTGMDLGSQCYATTPPVSMPLSYVKHEDIQRYVEEETMPDQDLGSYTKFTGSGGSQPEGGQESSAGFGRALLDDHTSSPGNSVTEHLPCIRDTEGHVCSGFGEQQNGFSRNVGYVPNSANSFAYSTGEIGSYSRFGEQPNISHTSNPRNVSGRSDNVNDSYSRHSANPTRNPTNEMRNLVDGIDSYSQFAEPQNTSTSNYVPAANSSSGTNSSCETDSYSRFAQQQNTSTSNYVPVANSSSGTNSSCETDSYSRFAEPQNTSTSNYVPAANSSSGTNSSCETDSYSRFAEPQNTSTSNYVPAANSSSGTNSSCETDSYSRFAQQQNTQTNNYVPAANSSSGTNSSCETDSYSRFAEPQNTSTSNYVPAANSSSGTNSSCETDSYSRFAEPQNTSTSNYVPAANSSSGTNSSCETDSYSRFAQQQNTSTSNYVPAANSSSGTNSSFETDPYSRFVEKQNTSTNNYAPVANPPIRTNSSGDIDSYSRFVEKQNTSTNNYVPAENPPIRTNNSDGIDSYSRFAERQNTSTNNYVPAENPPIRTNNSDGIDSYSRFAERQNTSTNNYVPAENPPIRTNNSGDIDSYSRFAEQQNTSTNNYFPATNSTQIPEITEIPIFLGKDNFQTRILPPQLDVNYNNRNHHKSKDDFVVVDDFLFDTLAQDISTQDELTNEVAPDVTDELTGREWDYESPPSVWERRPRPSPSFFPEEDPVNLKETVL